MLFQTYKTVISIFHSVKLKTQTFYLKFHLQLIRSLKSFHLLYVFCRERVANEQFLQPFMQTKETNPMFIYMHCLYNHSFIAKVFGFFHKSLHEFYI